MASAQKRMKQKRENAAMSSPASIPSPTFTAAGVGVVGASPRNNNDSTITGSGSGNVNKNHSIMVKSVPTSPGRMAPVGGGSSSQFDSSAMLPAEFQYASPQQRQQQQQQYSPRDYNGHNNNTRYQQQQQQQQQQQYHPPQTPAPSPLANSPNRPMRKEEPFDSAIQHRGNYAHHLPPSPRKRGPTRPRRGYDSYTEAPKGEQEKFNQQYYTQIQQQQQQQQAAPHPPPPPPPPPQPRQHQQGDVAAFNPFAPSPPPPPPLHVPNNTASGNNNNNDLHHQHQQQQPRNNERMSPYLQDAQLVVDETIIMNGEYEYDITAEDEEAYADEHTDMVAPMTTMMQQQRTPAYSKHIDEETVSSEVALSGDASNKKKEKKSKKSSSRSKDARIIHNVGSDDAMDKPASVSDPRYGIHLTGSNHDGDDNVEEEEEEGSNASPNRQYNYVDIAAHAGRYAAASQPDSFAPKPNKAKTTNPFDDNTSFSSKGGHVLPKRIGNANSWDGGDENSKSSHAADNENGKSNNVPVWDGGKKQRNMWEDDNSNTMQKFDRNSKSWDQENKDSFEQNLWAGSFFGESGSQSKQKDENPKEQKLAEWDKAEADWQNKVSSPAAAGTKESQKDKQLDSVMDKNYPWKAQQQDPSSAPRKYTGQTEVNVPVSDSEESDADSLFKFENRKKKQQASDARNETQNVHGIESDRSTDQSSSFQNGNKFEDPTYPSRSVAFAGEEENKVHTYLVPQEQEQERSESDSGTYETRDDEDDEETDGGTLEDGDTLDNYTLDDATYGESTIDTRTIDTRQTENDTNILDHVDTAVAAIGSAIGGLSAIASGLILSATKAASENDETTGPETTEEGTNAKAAVKSENDWMGAMEKFLFPEEVSLK